jgi:hypothetical protein
MVFFLDLFDVFKQVDLYISTVPKESHSFQRSVGFLFLSIIFVITLNIAFFLSIYIELLKKNVHQSTQLGFISLIIFYKKKINIPSFIPKRYKIRNFTISLLYKNILEIITQSIYQSIKAISTLDSS